MPDSFSYRDAGVDIDREAEGIRALITALTYRRKGSFSMTGGVGHFAGLIDFGDLVLALTDDGVGTKMLVADRERDWSTVGIDCNAMNVNDLYVMNMEPVAFVDYIATDKLSVEKMAQIGIGLNDGGTTGEHRYRGRRDRFAPRPCQRSRPCRHLPRDAEKRQDYNR